MASFNINGLDELILDMEEMAKLPDSVLDEMVTAGGEVIRKAQSQSAAAMLKGPYYRGAVSAGVTLGKPRSRRDGRAVTISFEGEQHGNRLAEIAYVNEFGKKSQVARPFIKTANEAHADEAVDAELKVYDAWLKSKNL